MKISAHFMDPVYPRLDHRIVCKSFIFSIVHEIVMTVVWATYHCIVAEVGEFDVIS